MTEQGKKTAANFAMAMLGTVVLTGVILVAGGLLAAALTEEDPDPDWLDFIDKLGNR